MLRPPSVEISPRAARRLRDGHPWVYRSDVGAVEGASAGDVVQLRVRRERGGAQALGWAFYNPASLIVLRLITREATPPDRAFWRARLEEALALRRALDRSGNAERLVFSEADGIPGLIVDRYDRVLVIQTLCAGADVLLPLWQELLGELLAPQAVVERNDVASRKLEALPERSGLLSGRLDGPVEIEDGGLRWQVDPLQGQKTGYYLDQSENRVRAASYARGRCLDVFSYQGGFGLQLARGGADSVVLVDQSERALEAATAAARLNGLTVSTRVANAFDWLRQQQADGERYDVIALDPPAFAKNRAALEGAVRGYKEINLRAMRLLERGGILITSSCSYHMQEANFEALLLSAALDAGRWVQRLERRSQSRDHPERLGFPESRYLKCFVLRIL